MAKQKRDFKDSLLNLESEIQSGQDTINYSEAVRREEERKKKAKEEFNKNKNK